MHRTLRPRSRTLVAIRLLILFCVLWLPFRSPPVVSATTHTVTVTDDYGWDDDPVDGSLRKAIEDAASGDTIIFDPGLAGQTITLEDTLVLEKSVTIDGSTLASPITISGGGAAQVFEVDYDTAVVMVGLGIADGGSPNSGLGAIMNYGDLTVVDCTLTGNRASSGGAMHNYGTLTVAQSAFLGNTAASSGGAIYSDDYLADTSLTVANCTFSGNTANSGGAICATNTYEGEWDHDLTVTHSTFSGNVAPWNAALVSGASTTLANNIMDDSGDDPDCLVASGAMLVNTNNVIEDGSCPSDTNLAEDPLLGPLANYGGPTQTFALLPGSPAINAGDEAHCPDADQRGVGRPQGEGCDIGAYEVAAPTARTDPADGVGTSSATLWGAVHAGDWPAAARFEYGETTAYGTTVPVGGGPITGTVEVPMSHALTGLQPSTTYHYCLAAENAIGSAWGNDQTFTTEAIPPTVETGGADGITAAGATLHGAANAHNAETGVWFEYWPEGGGAQSASAAPATVTGAGDTSVSLTLADLLPKTDYYYRVVAESAGGLTQGTEASFTTLASAPTARTDDADEVTSGGATLHGTVNARNAVADVWFEYGLTDAYGSEAPATPATASGTADTAVRLALAGLAPSTTYHYRVVAENATGTTYGEDATLTTEAPPPDPTPGTTPDATPGTTPDLTAQPTPDLTAQPTPDLTAQPTPDLTAQPTPGAAHRILLPLIQR